MKRRAVAAVVAFVLAGGAAADTYPSKPITFVTPAFAGGALDVVARSLADEMSKTLGKPIVVDNRPGAGGVIATQTVIRAEPDGYSVLVTHSGPILNMPYMLPKAPYDVRRDLRFVAQLCTGPLVLAVNTNQVPAKTLKEFVDWAGKNRGRVTYGSSGVGSAGHLLSAYLSKSRDLDMEHAAYKGEPPLAQDLIGGQLTMAVVSAATLVPQLSSGKIRALAVLGDRRLAELPNVPTAAEAGFPDPEFKAVGWVGVMVAANTPAPIVEKLEKEARAASQTTALKARFQAAGMQGTGLDSTAFREDYERTVKLTERLIDLSGAKMQ